MVSFKTLAGAALAALPTTSAFIAHMVAPDTAAEGADITVTFETSIYIENWSDYSIIWGLAPTSLACGDIICIGRQFDYTTLYPEDHTGNFTVTVTLPTDTTAGDYQLVAAVPYLVGASGETSVRSFSSNITITSS